MDKGFMEKKLGRWRIFKNYKECLEANAEAIMTALAENDVCAVQKIFEKCGVPEEDRLELMKKALDCWFEERGHTW